jgi:hypothetical protein
MCFEEFRGEGAMAVAQQKSIIDGVRRRSRF